MADAPYRWIIIAAGGVTGCVVMPFRLFAKPPVVGAFA
jgi:hypothetical protein